MEHLLRQRKGEGNMAACKAANGIAFLFKEGRHARLTAGVPGPREFFYGYA